MALKKYLLKNTGSKLNNQPHHRGHSEHCECDQCTGNTNGQGSITPDEEIAVYEPVAISTESLVNGIVGLESISLT